MNTAWHEKLYTPDSAKFTIDSPRSKNIARRQIRELIQLLGLKKEKVIQELLKCLKPGGHLVIDTANRDHLRRIWRPIYWHQRGQTISSEIRNYEPDTKYNQGIQCFVDLKSGIVRGLYYRLRMYSGSELVRLLKKLGAKKVKLYENFQGSPYHSKSSKRIVLVAQI